MTFQSKLYVYGHQERTWKHQRLCFVRFALIKRMILVRNFEQKWKNKEVKVSLWSLLFKGQFWHRHCWEFGHWLYFFFSFLLPGYCRWRGVALHCYPRASATHVPWLLADGVGTGGECYSHGHSWRGTLNHRIQFFLMWAHLLLSSLSTPVTCFFYQQPFFLLLCLNIWLYCYNTIQCNFLILWQVLKRNKQNPRFPLPLPPASLQFGQTKERCFHWNVRALNCSWLKWHRLPPRPGPVLHTVTLISWKDTRSCCFRRSVHVTKNPKQNQPFYSYAKWNSYFYCNPRTMCYVIKTGTRC